MAFYHIILRKERETKPPRRRKQQSKMAVQFCCSMDEDRDGCRHSFRPLVEPMVEGVESAGKAALLINKKLWSIPGVWHITFKANQTPQILSPSQVTPLTLQSLHCPKGKEGRPRRSRRRQQFLDGSGRVCTN